MDVGGTVDPRFARFARPSPPWSPDAAGTGAAIAAWHEGTWVVDLWGGWADAGCTRPWERDSIVQPYSVRKSVRGARAHSSSSTAAELELDEPVQRYWPEFLRASDRSPRALAPGGRRRARRTGADGGLLRLGRVCARLARQEPLWPPGDCARRIGALLRAPGRRARAACGRALARALPPGRGRTRVCVRPDRGRAGPRGGG